MAYETIGNYQLRLFAYELPEPGKWDPFVTIMQFDPDSQDFKCLVEKHHASDTPLTSYDAAIDAARRVGNALIESGNLRQ
jgi:hypothetical protein